MTTPLRMIAAYIPLVAIVIGLGLQNWQRPVARRILTMICLGFSVLQLIVWPSQFNQSQAYDIRPILAGAELAKQADFSPRIEILANKMPFNYGDYETMLEVNNTLVAGGSQVFAYSPSFGYRREQFTVGTLVPGDVLSVSEEGFLNLKNPVCYVYPEENNCRPGDHFRADQIETAKRFVSYQPWQFNMSSAQIIANYLTLAALLMTVLWLLLSSLLFSYSKAVQWKQNQELPPAQ